VGRYRRRGRRQRGQRRRVKTLRKLVTQKQTILNRLQRGTRFSTVECVRDFHILRLGARIWDLRHDGYEIEERRVEGKNWSKYRLRPPRPFKCHRDRQPLPLHLPAHHTGQGIRTAPIMSRSLTRKSPTHEDREKSSLQLSAWSRFDCVVQWRARTSRCGDWGGAANCLTLAVRLGE
jgi:hypothetical protein